MLKKTGFIIAMFLAGIFVMEAQAQSGSVTLKDGTVLSAEVVDILLEDMAIRGVIIQAITEKLSCVATYAITEQTIGEANEVLDCLNHQNGRLEILYQMQEDNRLKRIEIMNRSIS